MAHAARHPVHDNIGGNTEIVRRLGRPVNALFAFKNWWVAKYKRKGKGFYFCDHYGKDAYPRSNAAREIMDADTMIALSRARPRWRTRWSCWTDTSRKYDAFQKK